jgi:hypothetical protein
MDSRRQGQALANVLILTLLTTAFLIAGVRFVTDSLKQGRLNRRDNQIYNVGLAGISHAVSWLRKQATKPVTRFDPRAVAEPDEDTETIAADEQIGLCAEFVLDASTNLWARYEIGRSSNAPARGVFPQGASHPNTTVYPNGIRWVAKDIGKQRGLAAGEAWSIQCKAYTFTKAGGQTFMTDTKRKAILLEAEIRRAAIHTREAALYSFNASTATDTVLLEDAGSGSCTINVLDGIGRPYWSNTDKVTLAGGPIFGTPPLASEKNKSVASDPLFVDPNLAEQLIYVFGTSDLEAVKAMAANVYVNSADLPQPMPANAFTYFDGDLDFDGSPVLGGGGILFVEGDLMIDDGSNLQSFNGLIFTTGKYAQRHKSTVTGGVICGGTAEVHGHGSGKEAVLSYSKDKLDSVASILDDYRLEHATIKVLPDNISPQPTF